MGHSGCAGWRQGRARSRGRRWSPGAASSQATRRKKAASAWALAACACSAASSAGAALRTDVPAAREAYLRARVHLNRRTGEDLRRALDAYRAAAAADPTFAEAYAGMAEAYALMVWYVGAAPNEVMPRARAAARKYPSPHPSSSRRPAGLCLCSQSTFIAAGRS